MTNRGAIIAVATPPLYWSRPALTFTACSRDRFMFLREREPRFRDSWPVIFANSSFPTWPRVMLRDAVRIAPPRPDGFDLVVSGNRATDSLLAEYTGDPVEAVIRAAAIIAATAPSGPLWEVGAHASQGIIAIGAVLGRSHYAAAAAIDPAWHPSALTLAACTRHKVESKTEYDSEAALLNNQIRGLQS